MRKSTHTHLALIAKLGPRAFEGISGEVVQVALSVINIEPDVEAPLWIADFSSLRKPADKAIALKEETFVCSSASAQSRHLENRILANAGTGTHLIDVASVFAGSKPGQTSRVVRRFWEIDLEKSVWMQMSSVPDGSAFYSGKSLVILRPDEMRRLGITGFDTVGGDARGRNGILIAKMGDLPSALYDGTYYDDNAYVIIPKRQQDHAAIWLWTQSEDFNVAVRTISQKSAVPVGAISATKLDVERWRSLGERLEQFPEPFSDDPSQWLFKGDPVGSSAPLQVGVARLLGFRWPDQKPHSLDSMVDDDGIVCLPAVAGEQAAAERVRAVLATAYGDLWSSSVLDELLVSVGVRYPTPWPHRGPGCSAIIRWCIFRHYNLHPFSLPLPPFAL